MLSTKPNFKRLFVFLVSALILLHLVIPYALQRDSSSNAVKPAKAAVAFNRQAAVAWAVANNYGDGSGRGSSEGRWCATYIGRAWAAGGMPDASASWTGNNQIVRWMLNHPNDWEFRDKNALELGDIVLLSYNSSAGTSNWSYINEHGQSLWDHSAIVTGTGLLSAWNNERLNVSMNFFSTFPAQLGVHIKTDNSSSPNLLTNPGFEQNMTAWAWTSSNNCAWTTAYGGAHSGSRMLSTQRQSANRCHSLYQDVNISPQAGTVYTASFWGRRGWDGVPRNGRLAIWALGGQQENIGLPFPALSSADYQCFSVTLNVIRSGHTGIRFEIYMDDVGSPDYQFDTTSLRAGTRSDCPAPPTAIPSPTPTHTSTLLPPRPDTIGLYKDGVFYLRNSNSAGVADITVGFGGDPSDRPVVGDWNGDTVDTVGVYRSSTGWFYLSSSNTVPDAPYQVLLGNPGDTPFAGKWRADMVGDGVGVFRTSNGILYQKRDLTSGFSDYFAVFGNPGDTGFAGDWDGNGLDSIGVYRPSNTTWYMTNNSEPSGITFGDLGFAWDIGIGMPVVGDWNADRTSTVGYRLGTTFILHSTNAVTGTDTSFTFGVAGGYPIAGKWTVGNISNPVMLIQPASNTGNSNDNGDGAD
jgi:hypothetical protein